VECSGVWVVATVPSRLWTAMEFAFAIGFGSNFAKISSRLPVAIFCQIDATQYKTHKFLRGHVHWLTTGKKNATGKPLASYWLSTGGYCQNLQKNNVSSVSTLQSVQPYCACFSPITCHKADDDSNDGELAWAWILPSCRTMGGQ
jgi:hypothetical protein